jgi:hypothetical protein
MSSAVRKPWDDHSARWKREAEKQGLTKQRWDAWRKLSTKTRKDVDPRKYASGKPVVEVRREKLEAAAISHIIATLGNRVRRSTVIRGVEIMTNEELRFAATANRDQLGKRAARKTTGQVRNPFWYR